MQNEIQKVLEDMRSHPEKYDEIYQKVTAATTDEEKAEILLRFATSFEDIQGTVDEGSGAVVAGTTITTIGFTTTISAYRDEESK